MNIDWTKLPKGMVCFCAYSDFSGGYFYAIDESDGALKQYDTDWSDPVEFVFLDDDCREIIAVSPLISALDFAKAAAKSYAIFHKFEQKNRAEKVDK